MSRLFSQFHLLLQAYRRKDIFSMAASLSFFMILSMGPMLLMLLSLAGYYLDASEQTLADILVLIDSVVPTAKNALAANLHSMVDKKITFGSVGFLIMFATSSTLFASLEKVINGLLHSGERHPFWLTRLLFVLWVIILTSLFLFSFMWDSLFKMMHWKMLPHLHPIGFNLWFLFVAWIFFVSILMLLPKKRLSFSLVLKVGLGFAVMLELARILFKCYSAMAISRYNVLYGSLTSLILGILWIFYFNNILLGCVLWIDQHNSAQVSHAKITS